MCVLIQCALAINEEEGAKTEMLQINQKENIENYQGIVHNML